MITGTQVTSPLSYYVVMVLHSCILFIRINQGYFTRVSELDLKHKSPGFRVF